MSFIGAYALATSAAFTHPGANPPDLNALAPLNVGTTAQEKQGPLGAPEFFDSNDPTGTFVLNPSGLSMLKGAIDQTDPSRTIALDVSNSIIANVKDPQRAQDVATKKYIDDTALALANTTFPVRSFVPAASMSNSRIGGLAYNPSNGYVYAVDRKAHRFDPETGTWTQVPSTPVVRSEQGVIQVNGKIYAVEGWNTGASCGSDPWRGSSWCTYYTDPYDGISVYDPATNAWSTTGPSGLSSNKKFTNYNRITAIGGRIYYIYFYDDWCSGGDCYQIYEFNTVTPSASRVVTTLPFMFDDRDEGAMFSDNENLYVIGTHNGNDDKYHVYNLASNTWTLRTGFPWGTYESRPDVVAFADTNEFIIFNNYSIGPGSSDGHTFYQGQLSDLSLKTTAKFAKTDGNKPTNTLVTMTTDGQDWVWMEDGDNFFQIYLPRLFSGEPLFHAYPML